MLASPIGFTSLPLDVVECITDYLDVEDLFACSLVSSDWRELLNNDVLWSKRCVGKYKWKPYAEHLLNQKSHVEPIFQIPQCTYGLQPLCVWRMYFMTQYHFQKNIKTGRNQTYEVGGNFNTYQAYYEGDNIVIIPAKDYSYEIWNTDGVPYPEDVINCAINTDNRFVHVHDNFIVILQLNLLQVYEKCGTYKLLYRMFFDKIEKHSLNIPMSTDLTNWYECNVCCIQNVNTRLYKKICLKNIFIGYVESDLKNTGSVFHIWDVKKGIKLKEQQFLTFPDTVKDVEFYKTECLVYIVFKTKSLNNSEKITIVGYNVDIQNYTDICVDLNINYSCHGLYYVFESNYIAAIYHNQIHFWNTLKGLKQQNFEDTLTSPFPFAVVIVNSKMLYAGNGMYSKVITVINLENETILGRVNFNYPIYRLWSVKPNLLLIKGNTRGTAEYEITVRLLDDIIDCDKPTLTKQCIHLLKVREQFSGTLKMTKLISIQPKIFSVTHFW